MTQVLMDAALGGDGQTYTDDGTNKNLDNGGHRSNFLPLMTAVLGVTAYAKTKATEAQASAASALSAPGTQATSSTSFSLATGSKVFVLDQGGKVFPLGARVSVARTSDPTKVCYGTITAFVDPDLTVLIDQADVAGGPYIDWTIALTGARGPIGASAANYLGTVSKSSAYTIVRDDRGKKISCSGTFNLALDTPANLGTDFCCYIENTGAGVITITSALDGRASTKVYGGEAFEIQGDGTNLRSLGRSTLVRTSTVSIASPVGSVDIETEYGDAELRSIIHICEAVSNDTAATTASLRVKIGGTYDAEANYSYAGMSALTNTTYSETHSSTATSHPLFTGTIADNGMFSGRVTVDNIQSSALVGRTIVSRIVSGGISNVPAVTDIISTHTVAAAIQGVRFFPSAGNFDAGSIHTYGVRA